MGEGEGRRAGSARTGSLAREGAGRGGDGEGIAAGVAEEEVESRLAG